MFIRIREEDKKQTEKSKNKVRINRNISDTRSENIVFYIRTHFPVNPSQYTHTLTSDFHFLCVSLSFSSVVDAFIFSECNKFNHLSSQLTSKSTHIHKHTRRNNIEVRTHSFSIYVCLCASLLLKCKRKSCIV